MGVLAVFLKPVQDDLRTRGNENGSTNGTWVRKKVYCRKLLQLV